MDDTYQIGKKFSKMSFIVLLMFVVNAIGHRWYDCSWKLLKVSQNLPEWKC